MQRFFHIIQFERFDDGFNLFHTLNPSIANNMVQIGCVFAKGDSRCAAMPARDQSCSKLMQRCINIMHPLSSKT
jgi:hypothetical protein